MLFFYRLMGVFALTSLLSGHVTRKDTLLWYLDLTLVVISVMSEGAALIGRYKRKKAEKNNEA